MWLRSKIPRKYYKRRKLKLRSETTSNHDGLTHALPLRWCGSRLGIQDHSDHCASNKRSWWIHDHSGFISSFDAPWSERSWITDPDPDHPKGMHPKSEPQDTFNWLISDMVNNVYAEKIIIFCQSLKAVTWWHLWHFSTLPSMKK